MKKLYIKGRRKLDIEYAKLMIKKHGFWFVDVPRTSSTSIRVELGKRFGRAYGKLNVIESEHANSQVFEDHVPALVMRKILGKKTWNKIFTFTMVRNPWDRALSLYNYRKKINSLPEEWDFHQYLNELSKADKNSPKFAFHGYRDSASDYILDEKGKIIVDYIAKYENRADDLKQIAEKIGMKDFGNLKVQKASSDKKHYSEFYNEESKAIIETLFAKDIEIFDYVFEKPHSSN